MRGIDLINFLEKYKGKPYVFGVVVPKKEANYSGDKGFDCAEFITYGSGQVYGFFGFGTRGGDAFTGYMVQDFEKFGRKITVEQAARTPGAILMREPKPGAIGHTAASKGDGTTIEAHSTKYGVTNSKVDGRRWDYGFLFDGVEYTENKPVKTSAPKVTFRLKTPMMKDSFIEVLQKALKKEGFYNEPKTDEFFGPKLNAAVIAYQKKKGLVVDGEVMPGGETAKSLNI